MSARPGGAWEDGEPRDRTCREANAMTGDELMERAAAAAHSAWWEAKKAQGFHAPESCPGATRSLACRLCHNDMRPYADLDEATKDLDRAHVRAVLGVCVGELERLRGLIGALHDAGEKVKT